MSFLIRCPNCGDRDVYEFRYGGAVRPRPSPDAPQQEWLDYSFTRENAADRRQEWWYHRLGCRQWFFAVRDSRNNQVERTFLPESPA
jgi:heterotetrameric sarcosine oxidase delta subunit